MLLSRDGSELDREPDSPAENSGLEVPLDGPASVAFLGRRVLVTNHSPLTGNPRSWAVLNVYAGERGLRLFAPRTGMRKRLPRRSR